MSERGSFVTEYIYCDKCFQAVKKILKGNGKFLCTVVIPAWKHCDAKELPIIAGKIGGLYQGEELVEFEFTLIPLIEDVICHPVRIAVLAECGEEIFTVNPSTEEERAQRRTLRKQKNKDTRKFLKNWDIALRNRLNDVINPFVQHLKRRKTNDKS